MKKQWKKWAVLLALGAMLLALAACGSNANAAYVGKYNLVSHTSAGRETGTQGEYLDLQSGSRAALDLSGEPDEVKYTVDNGVITLKMGGEDDLSGTIEGDVIVLNANAQGTDNVLTFAREGSEKETELRAAAAQAKADFDAQLDSMSEEELAALYGDLFGDGGDGSTE